MTRRILFGLLLIVAAVSAADWQWTLRPGFPPPPVPADNPMTPEKVELGRHLFYDQRMSVNGKGACSGCHIQSLAFTEGHAHPTSVVGDSHPRSAMSLVNVGYAPTLSWANSKLTSLEEQAMAPILDLEPIIQLGLLDHEEEFLDMVRKDPTYKRLFPAAFPGEAEVSFKQVAKALAAFERSIVSMRSPYDRYKFDGDASAISASAKRGEAIFSSPERAGCIQCHGGLNFSGSSFFNTGVSKYEAPNRGAYEDTGRFDDFGKFRVPTLRNIAITDPYMHDGSLDTLTEVIDHYAAGGKYDQANKTRILRPFFLSEDEKSDLVEFLKSLTDEELLRDPRWSDPWPANPGNSGN